MWGRVGKGREGKEWEVKRKGNNRDKALKAETVTENVSEGRRRVRRKRREGLGRLKMKGRGARGRKGNGMERREEGKGK